MADTTDVPQLGYVKGTLLAVYGIINTVMMIQLLRREWESFPCSIMIRLFIAGFRCFFTALKWALDHLQRFNQWLFPHPPALSDELMKVSRVRYHNPYEYGNPMDLELYGNSDAKYGLVPPPGFKDESGLGRKEKHTLVSFDRYNGMPLVFTGDYQCQPKIISCCCDVVANVLAGIPLSEKSLIVQLYPFASDPGVTTWYEMRFKSIPQGGGAKPRIMCAVEPHTRLSVHGEPVKQCGYALSYQDILYQRATFGYKCSETDFSKTTGLGVDTVRTEVDELYVRGKANKIDSSTHIEFKDHQGNYIILRKVGDTITAIASSPIYLCQDPVKRLECTVSPTNNYTVAFKKDTTRAKAVSVTSLNSPIGHSRPLTRSPMKSSPRSPITDESPPVECIGVVRIDPNGELSSSSSSSQEPDYSTDPEEPGLE